MSKSMDEIPELGAQTADDIFDGIADEGGVLYVLFRMLIYL